MGLWEAVLLVLGITAVLGLFAVILSQRSATAVLGVTLQGTDLGRARMGDLDLDTSAGCWMKGAQSSPCSPWGEKGTSRESFRGQGGSRHLLGPAFSS